MKPGTGASVIDLHEHRKRKPIPIRGPARQATNDSYLDVNLHVWMSMSPGLSKERHVAELTVLVRFYPFRDAEERDAWFDKINHHLADDYRKCRALSNVIIVRMQRAVTANQTTIVPFSVARSDTYPAFHDSIDTKILLPIVDFIQGLLRYNSV